MTVMMMCLNLLLLHNPVYSCLNLYKRSWCSGRSRKCFKAIFRCELSTEFYLYKGPTFCLNSSPQVEFSVVGIYLHVSNKVMVIMTLSFLFSGSL